MTPKAAAALRCSLEEKWRRDPAGGKLTRELRGELLGVSGVTADRLLNRQVVDRTTAVVAFKEVGLCWHEEYDQSDQPLPEIVANDATCGGVPPSPTSCPSDLPTAPQRTKRSAPFRVWLTGSAALACVILPLLWRRSDLRPADPPTWKSAVNIVLYKGTALFHAADYDRAEAYMRVAVDLARQHNAEDELAGAIRMQADLAAARGSFDEAKADYEKALELRGEMLQEDHKPPILEAIRDLETRVGDYDGAEKVLLAALKGYRAFHDRIGVAMVDRDLGTVAFQTGNGRAAMTWFGASLAAVAGLSKPDIETDVHARQALVLRDRGLMDEARAQLQTCLRYWRAKRHSRWIAKTELQLASVDAAAHRMDEAVRLADDSRRLFLEVGDRSGVSDCERLLTAKGSVVNGLSGNPART